MLGKSYVQWFFCHTGTSRIASDMPLSPCVFLVTHGQNADFDREYIRGHIEQQGGSVLDSFQQLATVRNLRVF